MKNARFEQDYRGWANRLCLLLLVAHIPAYMGVAAWFGAGVLVALLVGVCLLAGPVALFLHDRRSSLTSISIAVSSMGMSALLIHLGRGMIEMHFHIFTTLAVLIIFGSVWPLLAAALVIALHHVVFWLLMP